MLYRRIIHYSPVLLFTVITLLLPGDSQAVDYDFMGQVSGWAIESRHKKTWSNKSGLRYIPRLIVKQPINDDSFIDTEVSINGFLAGGSDTDKNSDLELYRLKLRFSTARTETRIGLQKINFGPALLLRPLRWFDRLDPRDPLKLTDGVYGLLLRYTFQNNANIWLWGLYNNDLKGWETTPTEDNGIEFGGRFQYPIFTGEAGITYHHRKADFSEISSHSSVLNKNIVEENRFAFDCKFDVKIGLWFEGTIIQRDTNIPFMKYQRMWTVGADYTFGMGNGLNVLTEFFNSENSDEIFRAGEGIQFSGSSVNYPVGIFDQVSGMHYYDWTNHDNYMLFNWQRTYDNWILHLIGFFNPETVRLNQTQTGSNAFSGNGFHIMVVFNH